MGVQEKLCTLLYMITHWPSNTKKLKNLPGQRPYQGSGRDNHVLPLPRSVGARPTLWGWPGGTLQNTAGAASEANSTSSFPPASAAHSCLQSSLTAKGAELPTFLLKWHQLRPFSRGPTHIPQLSSIAVPWATSNPS